MLSTAKEGIVSVYKLDDCQSQMAVAKQVSFLRSRDRFVCLAAGGVVSTKMLIITVMLTIAELSIPLCGRGAPQYPALQVLCRRTTSWY
jgi:hypothetical protein